MKKNPNRVIVAFWGAIISFFKVRNINKYHPEHNDLI